VKSEPLTDAEFERLGGILGRFDNKKLGCLFVGVLRSVAYIFCDGSMRARHSRRARYTAKLLLLFRGAPRSP